MNKSYRLNQSKYTDLR